MIGLGWIVVVLLAVVAIVTPARAAEPMLLHEIAVAADYGLTVMSGASANAYRLAMFILSPDGQRALSTHGFAAPTLPQ